MQPFHICSTQAFRASVSKAVAGVRWKASYGRPRSPPAPRTAAACCKGHCFFLLTCANGCFFVMFFCVVLLRTKQSSKNGNKPKKSVGKSLLKKPYPSVAQAIRKQVCALSSLPVSTHLSRPLYTFESCLLPLF